MEISHLGLCFPSLALCCLAVGLYIFFHQKYASYEKKNTVGRIYIIFAFDLLKMNFHRQLVMTLKG